MQHEQLLIGIAAGLGLAALLHFKPSWREVVAAILAASLIDYAINSPALGRFVGDAAMRADEIPVYPHVCPCVALAFIGILAVLHVLRG